MEQQKMTFRQAWLYTIHHKEIIQPMLLSYAHFPSLIHSRILATLLNCSHENAKQIYSIAIKKSGLPPAHMFLDYTPNFFYRQAPRQRYKERLVPHELEETNQEYNRKRA